MEKEEASNRGKSLAFRDGSGELRSGYVEQTACGNGPGLVFVKENTCIRRAEKPSGRIVAPTASVALLSALV